MLGARISVANLAWKWGKSISMGEVLYSKKWVQYSALPWVITQNTTTTHNNQHELPLPYPPAALALSFHGNFSHAPKSWRCCSLWVRQWQCVGCALTLFCPLFGAPKHNPSKNRERDWVLELSGHLLVRQHSNQPKLGICGRRDIGRGRMIWAEPVGWTPYHHLGWQTERWKKNMSCP